MNENEKAPITAIRLRVNPPRAVDAHREVARLMAKSRMLRRRGYKLAELTLHAVLIRPSKE